MTHITARPHPAAPAAAPLDVADAWRDYVAVADRVDDMLDARDAVAERLAEAEDELLRRQAETAEDEERLRQWHADAAEAWEALVQRVGRAAAGPYPEPAGTGDGNPQKHLVRAQRTVSAPIRFPLLKVSLRMAAWGVVGAVLCCLAGFFLARWRLTATTDDDRTDPSLAGLAGGALVALVWLFVTVATM